MPLHEKLFCFGSGSLKFVFDLRRDQSRARVQSVNFAVAVRFENIAGISAKAIKNV